jgi:hypothetical protein
MYSMFGNYDRYTFRLDLAQSFDPRVFCKPALEFRSETTPTVVFKTPVEPNATHSTTGQVRICQCGYFSGRCGRFGGQS